jgi:hypothetical protein
MTIVSLEHFNSSDDFKNLDELLADYKNLVFMDE